MNAPLSDPSQIPGLGLPADPQTGLPVGDWERAEFFKWLLCMAGAIALAAGLYFGLAHAFMAPASSAAAPGVDGAALFAKTCSACHGAEGKGVTGLGKDMTTSAFVQGLGDAELIAFIKEGRAADHPDNTTHVPMPPYGGNPSLTDADLAAIVAHIRSL